MAVAICVSFYCKTHFVNTLAQNLAVENRAAAIYADISNQNISLLENIPF
jgi:hypothetical protein